MFSDPVFIFIASLVCLGLLFCLSILINTLGSNLMKTTAYTIALVTISTFVYLNYEAVSNLTESQDAANDQMIDSIEILNKYQRGWRRQIRLVPAQMSGTSRTRPVLGMNVVKI